MTRFSFHHLAQPTKVLAEMIRVYWPDGRVAVVNVAPLSENAEAFKYMEKLRIPFRVRAFSPEEFENIVRRSGLSIFGKSSFRLEMQLERQLVASFPNPGDVEKISQMFKDDLVTGSIGGRALLTDGQVCFSYPIQIIVGKKAGC